MSARSWLRICSNSISTSRYLQQFDIYVKPVIVKTSRLADGTAFRGGGSWRHYESDLRKLLGAKQFSWVSILVDFYAYPWDAPGADCCARPHQPRGCAEQRVQAMAATIDHRRFVPNVVLHEFETWVIAAAMGSTAVLGERAVATKLNAEVDIVGGDVELLNDSPLTAPSKRVLRCWPDYDKVTDGIEVIREAGLEAVIERCPGLKSWIDQLQAH
ncbi:DUF4276 family protein [Kribbella qitaiheensis]|uniref:DUF4276 family protein n=1 Tax=Kribbella qitaiheensis TaxID=1544730 RepID=UPI0016272B46|nr:DUF4276 family protein [Kribbella qitaiheensis]